MPETQHNGWIWNTSKDPAFLKIYYLIIPIHYLIISIQPAVN